MMIPIGTNSSPMPRNTRGCRQNMRHAPVIIWPQARRRAIRSARRGPSALREKPAQQQHGQARR